MTTIFEGGDGALIQAAKASPVVALDQTGSVTGAALSRAMPDLSEPVNPHMGHPELEFASDINSAVNSMRQTIYDQDCRLRRKSELVAQMYFGPKMTRLFFIERAAIGIVFEELGLTDRYYAATGKSTTDGGLGSWKLQLPRIDCPGLFTVHYAHAPANTRGRLQYFYAGRQ